MEPSTKKIRVQAMSAIGVGTKIPIHPFIFGITKKKKTKK